MTQWPNTFSESMTEPSFKTISSPDPKSFCLHFSSITLPAFTKSEHWSRYYINPIRNHNAHFHSFLFNLSELYRSFSFEPNGEFSPISLLIATASKPYLRRSSLSFGCWNRKSLPSPQNLDHTVSDSITLLRSVNHAFHLCSEILNISICELCYRVSFAVSIWLKLLSMEFNLCKLMQ